LPNWYAKKVGLILKILIGAAQKERRKSTFWSWPRARERKLLIGNLCCSFFFQAVSLFDLIFS
jgi:hypothetical protein